MPTEPFADPALEAALEETVAELGRDPRVRYAEVRYTDETVQDVRMRGARDAGRVDHVSESRSRGVGVRVLGARTWGFACTPSLEPARIRDAARRAATIAEASSRSRREAVPFPAREPARGSWSTRLQEDPFEIAIEAKLALLEAPVATLLARPRTAAAEAHMQWRRLDKLLSCTDGTRVRQRHVHGACGMHLVAADDAGETVRRSYPTWGGGDAFQGGYERARALGLAGHAPRIAEEAEELLAAPLCPEGERDLLLESSQVALQVHESCGHPTELDRAFGTEITLAGGSFLEPSMLGSFRYGSDVVTLTADAVTEGGLGTFGWDDEGTPAGRHTLVDRGVFVDYLSSRETAAMLGRESTGTMRASGWDRIPLIRMTNVSLAPGSGSLEDLVADTADGVLMATDRSWSIDDQRLDFQFACELAWEIKRGKRTRMLRSPLYAGRTPDFWASCDAVCGPEEWTMWGIASCGKGDPIQIMGVGHGAAPARFRRVRVGSSR